MTTEAEAVLDRALSLRPADRAQLIDRLFASFESPRDPALAAAWATEAEARIDTYERGEIQASTAEDVYARLEIG